jgi:secondary thiamine-phosphate synthase enzyme
MSALRIVTDYISISTKGNTDIVDVTAHVAEVVKKHKFAEGNATIFISGSTAGITTVEYEKGLRDDLPEAFEKIAPVGKLYHHDATWGDGNGYAHVRASLLGPTLIVPFSQGELLLGTWQQIVVIDFDNRSRSRKIVVQLIGE